MTQLFSPVGYVSFKKLWDANRAAFSWNNDHYEQMFAWIYETSEGAISIWMAKTLSLDELVEKVMFEVAFSEGIFLASPTGQVVSIDVEFFKSGESFHHVMNSTPEFFDENDRHFDSTRIYPERLSKIEDWRREGKDPWWSMRDDFGFCSINYYYDRDIYCISLEAFRQLESVSNGYFSTETLRVKRRFIEPFEGWSICVSEAAAERLSPSNLSEKFFLKTMCEALQLDENSYERKVNSSANSVGRPNVSIAAAKAFLKHFSLEHRPSWKEAVAKIRDEDGLDVSVRTLQRGLKQLNDDKKTS